MTESQLNERELTVTGRDADRDDFVLGYRARLVRGARLFEYRDGGWEILTHDGWERIRAIRSKPFHTIHVITEESPSGWYWSSDWDADSYLSQVRPYDPAAVEKASAPADEGTSVGRAIRPGREALTDRRRVPAREEEGQRRLVWRIATEAADDATAAMTATTPKSAAQLLRWIDGVWAFRARHLRDAGAAGSNLLELVVVVEEEAAEFFADSTYGEEVSRLIADLVARGRDAGVGCVVAIDGDQRRLPASGRGAVPAAEASS